MPRGWRRYYADGGHALDQHQWNKQKAAKEGKPLEAEAAPAAEAVLIEEPDLSLAGPAKAAPSSTAARIENPAWLLPPWPEDGSVDISVIFGACDRLQLAQRCIEAVRKSVGRFSYEIVVCDGGSTDGTREWLAAQLDVLLVGDWELDGAAAAYTRAFALVRGRYVVALNDDCAPIGNALERAAEALEADPGVGQVAFEFMRSQRQGWHFDAAAPGQLVAPYGMIRTDVARLAAAICGGFWASCYRTYGADYELSCWVRQLGYRVEGLPGVRIDDFFLETSGDRVRSANVAEQPKDAKLFFARWPKAAHQSGQALPAVSAEELARLESFKRGSGAGGVLERLKRCDPRDNEMPLRELRLSPERVLHLYIRSAVDDQAAQVAALKRLGAQGYARLAWMEVEAPAARFIELARDFQPTLVFGQIQQAGVFSADDFLAAKQACRAPLTIVTWNGDVGEHNSATLEGLRWVADLARGVDLTLWSSATHVDVLRKMGVAAAYLQIGFDEDRFYPAAAVEWGQDYDVAFLFHDHGRALYDAMGAHDESTLRFEAADALSAAFPRSAVGSKWPAPVSGDVYRRSYLAVSISVSSTLRRYSSDRLLRTLACTPTLVKRFDGCESFGLIDEHNCLLFDTVAELVAKAKAWLASERRNALWEIGQRGAQLVKTHHTWDVRMQELQPLLAAVR